MLARRTFFQHKSAFFDQATSKWKQSESRYDASAAHGTANDSAGYISDDSEFDRDLQRETSRPSKKRKRCGHCHKVLSASEFYRHKNLYYNGTTKEWVAQQGSSNCSHQQQFVDINGSGSSSEG